MPVLSIRQEKDLRAKVEFEGGEWTVDFHNPFIPEQEEELRWYFENHLEFPMLDTVRANGPRKAYGSTAPISLTTVPGCRIAGGIPQPKSRSDTG